MSVIPPVVKRHYLRAPDRRAAILEAANELVTEEGLSRLSISNVAARAKISRQLIYRHFVDVNEILLAIVEIRFATIFSQFDWAESEFNHDPGAVVQLQFRSGLALSVPDQHLVRSVFSGLDQLHPELRSGVAILRENLLDRWSLLTVPDRYRDPVVRARIWTIFNAMFGLWDFLNAGILSVDEAIVILTGYTSAFAQEFVVAKATDASSVP